MLQEKIQNDLKHAILNKDTDKRDLLRVIIGEMNRVGKILTDDAVLSIIKNMKDNAILMNNKIEIEILDQYLPKLLILEELDTIVLNKVKDLKGMEHMGKIMKELRDVFPGQFDGAIAAKMIKQYLS